MQDTGAWQCRQGTQTRMVTVALVARWARLGTRGPRNTRAAQPRCQRRGLADGSGAVAAKPRGTVGRKQPPSTPQLCFVLKSDPGAGRKALCVLCFRVLPKQVLFTGVLSILWDKDSRVKASLP